MKTKIDIDQTFEYARDEKFHREFLNGLYVVIGSAAAAALVLVIGALLLASWLKDNGVW